MDISPEQETAFEKVLSASLSRTVDFVKMAEAKNAALLAFASAWIVAIMNLLTGKSPLPLHYDLALRIAMPFFAIAALTAIYSFLPRMLKHFHQEESGAKNLLFFGDVATFKVAELRERMAERYSPPSAHACSQAFLDDLCVQISVNAKIAVRKFRMFNIAAMCVLIAVSALGAPPVYWAITAICGVLSV